MSEESNKYSEVFERIKTILNNKIKSIEQGSAKEFRENINNAIGTLPKDFDENGHIKKYDDGTYADGDGMTGAVYAMGDIIQVGLSELDDTLADTREATTNAINATSDANTATEAANTATANANTATQNAINATSDANTATEAANTATANANTATQNANRAAGVVDTLALEKLLPFFVVAKSDKSDSYPVEEYENGQQIKIEQTQGALWFKVSKQEENS